MGNQLQYILLGGPGALRILPELLLIMLLLLLLLLLLVLQELELLLCGIPEIDVSEWKRHSRYLGEYRRDREEHQVIKVSSVGMVR